MDFYIVIIRDNSMAGDINVNLFCSYRKAKKYSDEEDGLIVKRYLPDLYTAEDMANSLNEYCV